ncbi:hypothetical protein FCV25MIE_03686, partial [Fagus crenata]
FNCDRYCFSCVIYVVYNALILHWCVIYDYRNHETEKHLRLNSAIADVSAQLCADDAPNGAAVN